MSPRSIPRPFAACLPEFRNPPMAAVGDKWQSKLMASEESTFETELRAALASPVKAGLIEIVPHSDGIATRLSEAFPFFGSKIDWRATKGHLGALEPSRDRELPTFSAFFHRRSEELGRESVAYYLNDNQIDCSLRASLWTFSQYLQPIIEMPSHHYFVGDDLGWCMALTMEGDIDFGYAPGDVR